LKFSPRRRPSPGGVAFLPQLHFAHTAQNRAAFFGSSRFKGLESELRAGAAIA
jgi:hypothetical protein